MAILVIAEHDNQQLKTATLSTITAALLLSTQIVVLVIGYQCQSVALAVAKIAGVQKVLLADSSQYEQQLPENVAPFIVTLAAEFSHILMAATAFGKNLLPRVAALLDVAQISDVITIVTPDTFVRPIYAGNALATVCSSDAIKLLTIRTTHFIAASLTEKTAPIETVTTQIANTLSQWVAKQQPVSSRPDLTTADVVISGGRGLQSAANFALLEKIADHLNAALGASRAAVDAGYAPNDWQVGQTGKIVAPKLYIAVGISGAIQHLAGMKDSQIIVAINKDPDAPIFQIANYGLVGDLFQLLPELEAALVAKE